MLSANASSSRNRRSPASASNWILFYTGHDGSKDYLDSDTIKKIGAARRVWTKNIPKMPDKGGVASVVYYAEIDCDAATFRPLDGTQYDARGLPVLSSPIEMTALRIYPDSMGEALMQDVCD